jgi:nitroreductase
MTMTNAIIEFIVSRSTTKHYDPAVTLSDDQIRELVRIATTAPTSFHLQNWRFIAVRTPEAKARLSPIAWNQPAITEAAVTFPNSPARPMRTSARATATQLNQRGCSVSSTNGSRAATG